MTYQILKGNNLDLLPTLADNSIDSIVTDPPYELGFMGKKWDSSGIAYSVELWQQCLRVLKPGGHLLSFGGTRTWHRVAVAIEDAGFEIRDNIARFYGDPAYCQCDLPQVDWVYGTGEPQPQHSMRFMSDGNLSQTINPENKQGQVLQSQVQEQDLSSPEGTEPKQGSKDGKEPSLERRSDIQATQGQLLGCEVCEMSSGVSSDGQERRLHHGTQACNCQADRQVADSNRSSESQGPQSQQQSAEQSGTVPNQRGSQERRGWPICVGCGKPVSTTNAGHIAWVMGSGFPKSLDVSKAIDKAAGAERELRVNKKWADKYPNGPGGNLTQNGQIGQLKRIVGNPLMTSDPATPEAQQWQGWGTALKPAFEPVIVARKPLGGEIAVRCIIENELKKLGQEEITWTRPVNDAVKQSQTKTSGSTSQPKTAETFAKPVSASGMQNTGQTTESFIESQPEGLVNETQSELGNLPESLAKDSKTKSLQLTEKSVSAVENQTEHSLHLTTLTGADQSTENKPKARSGTSSDGKDSHLVIESFAGIATGLTGSLATVHINKLSDGTFEWPANLPEVEKVAPTVANNVLKWGTGGLNIDGSRIGTTDNLNGGRYSDGKDETDSVAFGAGVNKRSKNDFEQPQGRWPANIILDPYTAELLDEQSGTSSSKATSMKAGLVEGIGARNLSPKATAYESVRGHNDSGGASRFFYVAKASKRDRNEGLEELEATRVWDTSRKPENIGSNTPQNRSTEPRQNFHPTVKPTSLMQYLVKLVTPANGTVLDPFTGSGSTGKAAILEGFDFIGIEMTEDYWPIIEGRLKHAEAKVAERIKETSDKQSEVLF